MKAKVLVIGAGNIAQAYDSLDGPEIRTHIKGYRQSPEVFEIHTLFDIDQAKAEGVAKKWGIPHHSSDFEHLQQETFDVISICSPDSTHEFYLDAALLMRPTVIFIEKPLNITSEKAGSLLNYCLDKKILVLVNYSRVYIPEFRAMKEKIRSPEFGKILSVGIKYHGGFLHNCSHLINLIVFLFEPVIRKCILIEEIIDYSSSDPSISAIVQCNALGSNFTLTINAYDAKVLNMTEVDIISERQRICYFESKGSKVHHSTKHSYVDGIPLQEFILEWDYKIDYNYAMINAIGMISNFLAHTSDEAISEQLKLQIKTLQLLESIKTGIKI